MIRYCFIFVFLVTFEYHAQVRLAEYLLETKISLDLSISGDSSSETNSYSTPAQVVSTAWNGYPVKFLNRIYFNERYALLQFYLTDSETPFASATIIGNMQEALIDNKENIVYDLNKRSFFKSKKCDSIVPGTLINNGDSIFVCYLKNPTNPNDSAKITLNKNYPAFMKGGFLIKGNPFGIIAIESDFQNLKLNGYRKNVKFNLDKKAKATKRLCTLETAPVNLLFPE